MYADLALAERYNTQNDQNMRQTNFSSVRSTAEI
jgi:hypothetical protein